MGKHKAPHSLRNVENTLEAKCIQYLCSNVMFAKAIANNNNITKSQKTKCCKSCSLECLNVPRTKSQSSSALKNARIPKMVAGKKVHPKIEFC